MQLFSPMTADTREEIQALLNQASIEALATIASGSFEVARMARVDLLRSMAPADRRQMRRRLECEPGVPA